MNYETNKQIADNILNYEPPYYRSQFDTQYLARYNPIALNTRTFPSINDTQNSMKEFGIDYQFVPENRVVRENYSDNYRSENSVQEMYSPCMNCLSIYNTQASRSDFDKQYYTKYGELAMNTDTAFAPNRENQGLWSANSYYKS